MLDKQTHTRIPSNLDSALNGLRARRVLRDLMAAKSEYPSEFAMRLTKDTCTETEMQSQLGRPKALTGQDADNTFSLWNTKNKYIKKTCHPTVFLLPARGEALQ